MILVWVAVITGVIGMMARRRAVDARGASSGGHREVEGLGGRGRGSGRGIGGRGDTERVEDQGRDGTGRGNGGRGEADGIGGRGIGTNGRRSGTAGRGNGGQGDTEWSGSQVGGGSGGQRAANGSTDGQRTVSAGQDDAEYSGTRGSGGVGEHSSGASGGVEGSGARNNAGKNRKRRHRDRDEENSECALWDDEGTMINVPLRKDADPRNHRTRGYSSGGFGTYPASPTAVYIKHNQIDCPQAKRNLLAVTRMFWPDGCVGVRDIDKKSPTFWTTCIDEFLRYFTWDSNIATEQEARASILAHMRDNMRRTVADDKERADELIASFGGSCAKYRPGYVKPGVWSRLCEYWVTDEFKKKSDAGKKARSNVKAPHTSGARSFNRRERDYMKKHDGKLDKTLVYKECHTYKDKEKKGKWITKAAKKIIDRYVAICTKKGIDPKSTHLQFWIEAVGGIKKNSIQGHPRLRASDICGPEGRAPPRRKGEESSALTRIQDDLFLRVVDETLTQARANPEQFSLTPEQVRVLAREAVEAEKTSLPADHPIAKETQAAIIQVAVEVLNNLYKTNEPGADKGKVIDTGDEDDVDKAGSGNESTDSEDRDMSHPYVVVSRGGPVIKG